MDAALPKAFRYNERQVKVYAHRLKTNIDWSKEAAAAKSKGDPYDPPSDDDGDTARDDYVKRICGDGLGGMRRTQTVELLSLQTLADLHSSLVCWSDEQPERCDWQERLRRYIKRREAGEQPLESAFGTTEDDDSQDVRTARFTGRRRQTDAALVIEDKLYVKGIEHGDAAFEADYATLIDDWKGLVGNSDPKIASISKGGGLDLRFDQIDLIRVGQPYWILHQGDCVHCFVVEQVRALRPSENKALRKGLSTSNIEGAPVGTAFVPFPRITCLSTPTMLRFAADDKHNYGLGHHILRWEDSLAMTQPRAGAESKAAEGGTQGEASMPNPWQVANLRTRRKDEGLLRKKQGKCLACSWRKAQVGILGGKSVRLPLASVEVDESDGTQPEAAVDGLDDYLTSICTPCAAILGLPTLPMADGGSVELDWDRINSEKDRQAGWTVFPMY
uniref:snRNA-activating protein complex subunit 3 n=1 Tax=Kalmanozyma brasiliensis (strain GHG001) TaxID=1365824 RepID=V5EW50_KALBG